MELALAIHANKAVNELAAELASEKARVAALEARLAALEARPPARPPLAVQLVTAMQAAAEVPASDEASRIRRLEARFSRLDHRLAGFNAEGLAKRVLDLEYELQENKRRRTN